MSAVTPAPDDVPKLTQITDAQYREMLGLEPWEATPDGVFGIEEINAMRAKRDLPPLPTKPSYPSFTFSGEAGKALLTLKPDGSIILGGTLDEAARAFWKAVEQFGFKHPVTGFTQGDVAILREAADWLSSDQNDLYPDALRSVASRIASLLPPEGP